MGNQRRRSVRKDKGITNTMGWGEKKQSEVTSHVKSTHRSLSRVREAAKNGLFIDWPRRAADDHLPCLTPVYLRGHET